MPDSVRPVPGSAAPMPSVSQAFAAITASFGLALVAAYEAVASSAVHIGLLPALPLGLLTFVLAGAVALVAAAHLDERVLSR